MSEWHKVNDDDIELDTSGREVNLLVASNNSGNVYATLTWDQLDAITKKKNEWIEHKFNKEGLRDEKSKDQQQQA